MRSSNKVSTISQYIAIVAIIIQSGAFPMTLYIEGSYLFGLFLLFSIVFYLFNKTELNKSSFRILILLCCWVLVNHFFIQKNETNNVYIHLIINYISTFLIVSCFPFNIFKRKLLTCIQWLSFISIIIHELYWMELIPGVFSWHSGSDSAWTLSCYIFNVAWGGQNRLSSIFWEPGQYQIILNFTFVLCCTDIINLLKDRKISLLFKKYIVMVIALILTMSTTGYLTFALFCMAIALNIFNKKQAFSGCFMIAILSISAYALLQTDVVKDKFNQREDNTSYSIRMADNLGLLRMMYERPICGYGIHSKDFNSRAITLDNRTSSNGWLCAGAQLGIPFLLLILYLSWLGVKRITLESKLPVLFFMVILLAQANEAFYYLPFLVMFFFSFKNQSFYSNVKDNICSHPQKSIN